MGGGEIWFKSQIFVICDMWDDVEYDITCGVDLMSLMMWQTT